MMGGEPIFERHATESDFFLSPETEETAGVIRAVGDDPRLIIRVSISSTKDEQLCPHLVAAGSVARSSPYICNNNPSI